MGTLKDMLAHDRFAACAGVELLEISPGYAKARMEVTENHLNAGGVCQGGALFTLADLAFAAVANSREKLTLSLNAHITFLRPARKGYVYAEADEVFNHARVPFIEVRIVDEDQQLIAILTSSGYRKNEELDLDGLE
ncbi:MAG TPA: hotdog fold thioesterase [Candidatus Phocaeicola excrementigallinarum]|nr:hotdog fold thioesterase [Candidatus Phocaeicola excrementigallinarum]